MPDILRVNAIADLSWPVSLLDLALGMLMKTESAAPIYFSDYDPGYESTPFPGLYDSAMVGEVSPLLSTFEAAHITPDSVAAVHAFVLELTPYLAQADLLCELEETSETTDDPHVVCSALDSVSWSLLEGILEKSAS